MSNGLQYHTQIKVFKANSLDSKDKLFALPILHMNQKRWNAERYKQCVECIQQMA